MGQIKKHKKLFVILGVILVIVVFAVANFLLPYLKRHYQTVSVDFAGVTAAEKVDLGEKRILTVYFTRVGNSDFEEDVAAVSSASLMEENGTLIGNSQLLAAIVQNSAGGDLYAISTEKKYPSSYSDTVSEARDELDSNEEVALLGELPDFDKYDTMILIYPVWWGTVPNAVKTFLQSGDLSGITLYPVATHGGSGAGNSVQDIKNICTAEVSDKKLEVYDDDVTDAAQTVVEWLKTLQ